MASLASDSAGYQEPVSLVSNHKYATQVYNGQSTYRYTDSSQPPYAEVQELDIPATSAPVPLFKQVTSLKKLLRAVLLLVIICACFAATAIGLSLANLMKSTGEKTTPVQHNYPTPTECQTAVNFTETWRRDHSGGGITPRDGIANCDTIRLSLAGQPWFRFTEDAGSHLLSVCPSSNGSCGTHVAIWTDELMPSEVGVVTVVPIYGSWADDCKHYTHHLYTIRCSLTDNDFIYKYDGDDSCARGFCGMT